MGSRTDIVVDGVELELFKSKSFISLESKIALQTMIMRWNKTLTSIDVSESLNQMIHEMVFFCCHERVSWIIWRVRKKETISYSHNSLSVVPFQLSNKVIYHYELHMWVVVGKKKQHILIKSKGNRVWIGRVSCFFSLFFGLRKQTIYLFDSYLWQWNHSQSDSFEECGVVLSIFQKKKPASKSRWECFILIINTFLSMRFEYFSK